MQHLRPLACPITAMRLCLVILVACAHPPPSPVPPADVRPLRTIEPPPDVATPGLPLPVEDLWPLAHAPLALPHLALADAFGVTGEWSALCERRPDPVRKADRDLVLDYLYAWCAAGSGSIAKAGGELAELQHSASSAVADAAVDDLPDVLGFATADVALDARPDLDKLAAGYLAFDRFADAAVVMRALDGQSMPPGARCHRLVRAYLLAVGDRTRLAQQIQQASGDPACAAATPMFECPVAYGVWVPPAVDADLAHCAPLADAHPWLASRMHLAHLYQRWAQPRAARGWLQVATEESAQSFALPGVEEAALRALENAAITADCAHDLPAIQRAAAALPATVEHDRELDPRIAELRALTPASCRDWQRR